MITVATVAGFDPSGGAGILADIKTISFFGCYGVAAITSLTSQNTTGVFRTYNITREAFSQQLSPLFEDFEITAIKTGVLPTPEIVDAVAGAITTYSPRYVVLDPVIRSTSGHQFASPAAVEAMVRLLFPLASLVTPSAEETDRFTGIKIIDLDSMKRAGEALIKLGAKAALVKGGDVEGEMSTDVLVDEAGALTIASKRIESTSTHGTGCTLASAIACLLARGNSLRDSCAVAKQYVGEAIRTAPGLGHGAGPLNHFPSRFDVPGTRKY